MQNFVRVIARKSGSIRRTMKIINIIELYATLVHLSEIHVERVADSVNRHFVNDDQTSLCLLCTSECLCLCKFELYATHVGSCMTLSFQFIARDSFCLVGIGR